MFAFIKQVTKIIKLKIKFFKWPLGGIYILYKRAERKLQLHCFMVRCVSQEANPLEYVINLIYIKGGLFLRWHFGELGRCIYWTYLKSIEVSNSHELDVFSVCEVKHLLSGTFVSPDMNQMQPKKQLHLHQWALHRGAQPAAQADSELLKAD